MLSTFSYCLHSQGPTQVRPARQPPLPGLRRPTDQAQSAAPETSEHTALGQIRLQGLLNLAG